MSLVAELKRRKVFKVGAAYLVVAWLAVQGASIGFPAFEAPPWALRVFILVMLLGFPVALVMAWMFDATPEGVKLDVAARGSKRIFAVAGALAALALAWYFVGQPALRPAGAVDRSIAVLPFVNMSADPAQEFFSDGIAEELLNRLAQIPDLSVAARTSAFQFKGKNLDIAEIARKLNVAHVLEGSVRKDGARLRITAQLIDADSGFHLWSQTYERDATDVFRVQDEISSAIAQALALKLGTHAKTTAATSSADPAAYDDYLLARSLVARRFDDNLVRAIEAFDRAIARDSSYSPAHSGRAFAYAIAPGWSGRVLTEDAFPKALAGADHALELDPQNAEAFMVRGTVHSILFQEVAARADFDRALALAPGNVDILNFAGDNYLFTANLRAAERLKRQAMALDPLAFVHPANLATILTAQGRFREALVAGQRSVELGGGEFARRDVARAQLFLGELDNAAATVSAICKEVGGERANCLLFQVALHGVAGNQTELARASTALAARRPHFSEDNVFGSDVAAVYVNFTGNMERATEALSDLFRATDYNTVIALLLGPKGARLPEEISTDPKWIAIWSDPRLSETMAAYRSNLAAFRRGE